MANEAKKFGIVALNWNEVYYTNCPLVSASNVDQELGWTREEFKKIGVQYAFSALAARTTGTRTTSTTSTTSSALAVYSPRSTFTLTSAELRLLGATHVYEGGCMMVRARDNIYRMKDLKGKKIGLTKSLNTIKTDWWRIQEEQGIELMLMLNDMTRDDVEIVEFPYPDDWYDNPEMLEPMDNPSELWLKRDHKHDLAFRPLETALEQGVVDAIYTQSNPFQHLQEATGKFKAIEDLSKYPDWTLQVCNVPAVITCTDVMAEEHPELVVTFMKGMIKVGAGPTSTSTPQRRSSTSRRSTWTSRTHTEGIKDVDMVPTLSPQNLAAVEIGKDFMLSHGYIKNDFDVHEWAAPEFLEQAARELLEEQWQKVTAAKLPEVSEPLASGRRLG